MIKVILAEYLLQRGRKSKTSDIITIFSTSVIIDLIDMAIARANMRKVL